MPRALTLILLPRSEGLREAAVFVMWVLSGGDEMEETGRLFMKHLWSSRKAQNTLPRGQPESTDSLNRVEKFIFFQ